MIVCDAIFYYIFLRLKKGLYSSISLLVTVTLTFVVCELLIAILGGIGGYNAFCREIHRFEQVAATSYLFILPYFVANSVKLKASIKKTTCIVTLCGLTAFVIIAVIAYTIPDLFISVTEYAPRCYNNDEFLSRGKEGVLYNTRDLLLLVISIYCFSATLFNSFKIKSSFRYSIFILVGILFGWLGGLNDTIYIYTGFHFGIFGDLQYSRFVLGVTICTLLSSFSTIMYFLDRSEELEKITTELNISETRFTQVAMNIHEVFWLIDYDKTTKVFNLLFINPAFEKIWKKPTAMLFKDFSYWMESVHEDDRDKLNSIFIHFEKIACSEIEYRIILPDGSVRWIKDKYSEVQHLKKDIIRIARISEDITERKLMEEQLSYLAFHDPLTGLLNRKSFTEKLVEVINFAKRAKSDKNRALLFIDLDDFKDVNDSLGHKFGDELLKQVSLRITKLIRETDSVFRFGGDEFIVLLTSLNDYTDAGIVAQKIIEGLAVVYTISDHQVFIGSSIGISLFPQDGEESEALIKKADTALYEAKRDHNIYRFYTKAMEEKAIEKVSILNNLRIAIEQNEFRVYYQPIVDSNEEIVGVEALVRWHHPIWGVVQPSRFIPIAEDTIMINNIGEFVLKKACEDWQLIKERTGKKIFMSVNVSVKQFKDRDIIDTIIKTRDFYNLGQEDLHIEITESLFFDGLENVQEKSNLLKNSGIHISIDDFGTGYSSLSYLEKLPIANVKIDRSFIIDIPDGKMSSPLVESVVDIANRMNISIIVEGIENEAQRDYIKKLTSRAKMQGYLFSKPIPFNDLIKFILKI